MLCIFCMFIMYCTSCCHLYELWVHGMYVCMYVFMYVCRIYDDDESELVLAMHRIRSLGWKSKLPAISHIL